MSNRELFLRNSILTLSVTNLRNSCPDILFAFCFVFCISLPAYCQEYKDSKNQLAYKISVVIEEINAVRMKRLRLREECRDKINKIERQVECLKTELEKTKTTVDDEKKGVDDLEVNSERLRKSKKTAEYLIFRGAQMILIKLEDMRLRTSAGIPYNKVGREERIDRIIMGLKSSTLQIQSDAMKDYWEFSAEELRLSRSIDIWNEPVSLEDGKLQKHAYQVRLGLVNHFFVSEDGLTIGLAAKDNEHLWYLPIEPFQQRQLRIILEILQHRHPPEVIPVPYLLTPILFDRNSDQKKSKD